MTEFISDDLITQAAAEYVDALMHEFPVPAEGKNVFSPEFEDKMNHFLRCRKRKGLVKNICRWAAVLVAILITWGSLYITINAEAREKFKNWVRRVTDNSVQYTYHGKENKDAVLPEIEITYLPEGFELQKKNETESYLFFVFEKETTNIGSEKEILSFYYTLLNGASEVNISTKKDSVEYICIDGKIIDFYPDTSGNRINNIIYYNENAGILFGLGSTLCKEEMLDFCEKNNLFIIN